MRMDQDNAPGAGRRPWQMPAIAAVAAAVGVAAVFYDEASVEYQTWRYGAPGIARDASEDARLIASLLWPFARAICADPTIGAPELIRRIVGSDVVLWRHGEDLPERMGLLVDRPGRTVTIREGQVGIWTGGYDLTRRSGPTELHGRRLYGSRWDQGWMLQSLTVKGTLESVVIERLRLGPADGAAPSTLAIYDKDCGLIGASYSELDVVSVGSWEWQRMCFGPGWIETDCDALDDAFGRIVDVSTAPFDEEEKLCFDYTWSHAVPC